MSSSSTKALCLLALVIAVTIGAASAATAVTSSNNNNNNKIQRTLPGSCLMAASTLCSNADTNAMRCLTKLAIHGDARVPTACAEALKAGVTMNPRRNQASRTKKLARMLTEGPPCTGANNCPGDFGSVSHNQCNDANYGCSGCSKGTFTVTNTGFQFIPVLRSSTTNPNGIACSNICCRAANNNRGCCISFSTAPGVTSLDCLSAGHVQCNLP